MELSSAEVYVVKLQKYLASVLSSDSALYEKSKVRLRNLSQECHKAIQMIDRILEENRLRSYGDSIDSAEYQEKTSEEFQEFQYLINATNHVSHVAGRACVTAEQVGGLDFSEELSLTDDVGESLDETFEFNSPDMDEPQTCPSQGSLDEDEPDDESPSRAFHVSTVDFELRLDGSKGIPTDFNGDIAGSSDAEEKPVMFSESSEIAVSCSNPQYRTSMLLYTQVLHQLAEKQHPLDVCKELSVLIWTWFSTTFDETTLENYSVVEQFPRWIEDIVLLYAYQLSEGTEDKLIDEVRSWCGRTISEDQLSKSNLPPCVYLMDISSNPQQFTLGAAVLYDLLLDSGLRKLTEITNSESCLDANAVFDRIADVNPSALDAYRHYSVDPKILSECRIVDNSEIGGDLV